MLKYYAGGSLIVIFIILSILYKSNYKEKKIKKDDVELKDMGFEDFEDFSNWGQFIHIDE